MNIDPKNKFIWLGVTIVILVIASAFTDDPFALVEKMFNGIN